jgi:Fe(II)/alpha-ketoglutarate-dependent arginine beta-hydroxylase
MDRLQIDAAEKQAVNDLLDSYEHDFERLDADEVLHRATVVAHELPRRIRQHLNAFRLGQLSGVLCISGYEVDQERLGRTPGHWRELPDPSPAHREELLLLLYGTLLGDPFAWATQQNGRLIHDVLPIKGHEHEQLGSSSESLLTWHTEDAFHPMRGDFLTFACLRNPYLAATTVGYVDELDLPDDVRGVLFQERFVIHPDFSHTAKNNSAQSADTFSGIERMQTTPDKVAVLYGDPGQPYMRADPYFMTVDDGDHEARNALDVLVKTMDGLIRDMTLEEGDFCFLDNYRVVHGRKPFKARHDGTDRWLKRINVAVDLRKSRSTRGAAQLRTIR